MYNITYIYIPVETYMSTSCIQILLVISTMCMDFGPRLHPSCLSNEFGVCASMHEPTVQGDVLERYVCWFMLTHHHQSINKVILEMRHQLLPHLYVFL